MRKMSERLCVQARKGLQARSYRRGITSKGQYLVARSPEVVRIDPSSLAFTATTETSKLSSFLLSTPSVTLLLPTR